MHQTLVQKRSDNPGGRFGGERTWAIAIQRVFQANQSSELNFPFSLGKKRPEFRRDLTDLYEALLTAMAQVLPLLRDLKNFFQSLGF